MRLPNNDWQLFAFVLFLCRLFRNEGLRGPIVNQVFDFLRKKLALADEKKDVVEAKLNFSNVKTLHLP